jgi:thermitase
MVLVAALLFVIVSNTVAFLVFDSTGHARKEDILSTETKKDSEPLRLNQGNGVADDSSQKRLGRNHWIFMNKSDWEKHAKIKGDLAELTIGIDAPYQENLEKLQASLEKVGGRISKKIAIESQIKAVSASVPYDNIPAILEQLSTAKITRYAGPDRKITADFTPNDPDWNLQWGPKKIEADFAWNVTSGSRSVLVAVIDTGIDYTHPDLAPNYVPLGYDWVNNDTDPRDDHGHGTHCAGIIAAALNNAIGIAGLAQVRIMAEKGLDSQGSGYEDDLAQAIIHAVNQGADILSNSWGGNSPDPLIEDAIKYAYSHGVLIVAAAGNTASNRPHWPAAYDEVVAVTATQSDDKPAYFTTFGDWVEVSAPGSNIYSTVPWGYSSMSGTSMACPHVAGVAALILSRYPNMTNLRLRTALRYATDDLGDPGFDVYYGYGRINARKAVEGLPLNHDLILWNWTKPLFVEPHGSSLINTTVYNFGIHDESNIAVQLRANGTLVATKTIASLPSDQFALATLLWSPEVRGRYNLTVYVVPLPSETDTRFNVGSGYIDVDVPVRIVVLDSQGTSDFRTIEYAWNKLNRDWRLFGDHLIYIDYTSLAKKNITYQEINATRADVLFISCAVFREYTDEEIEAITRYVYEGHGLIATASSLGQTAPNNRKIAPLFGLSKLVYWNETISDTLNVLQPDHPLFTNFQSPYNLTELRMWGCTPSDNVWDGNELWGGTYVALGDEGLSAIVTYRGLVYISPYIEIAGIFDLSVPSNNLQLLYNAMTWTRYQAPEHELIASVDAPRFLLPNERANISATVHNVGLNNETNVSIHMMINGSVVYSYVFPSLPSNCSRTLVCQWQPTSSGVYNVTVFVEPKTGEDNPWNNADCAYADVLVPPDILLVADNDEYEDISTNQRTSLTEFKSALDSCNSEYYVWEERTKGSPPLELLKHIKLVIWSVGEAGEWVIQVSHADSLKLITYAKQGGKILMDGDLVADLHSQDTDFSAYVTHCVGLKRYAHPLLLGGTEGLKGTNRTHPVAFALPEEIRWDNLPIVVQGVEPAYGGVAVLNYLDNFEPPPAPWGYYPDPPVISWQSLVVSEKDGQGSTVFFPFPFFAISESVRARLLSNSLKWLLPRDHELSVTLGPFKNDFQELNRPALINVTVLNYGLCNESNLESRILIDGKVVDSEIIPSLVAGSFHSRSYLWFPDRVGELNITAQITRKIGEDAEDNVMSETVKVRHLVVGIISDPRWEMEIVAPILDAIDVGYHVFYYNKYLGYTKSLNFLSNYRAVILGKRNRALNASEHAALEAYLDAGGSLLVTDVALIHSTDWGSWNWGSITESNIDFLMADIVRASCVGARYLMDPEDRVLCPINASHPILDGLYGTFSVGHSITNLTPYSENVTANAARNANTVAKWISPKFFSRSRTGFPPDKIIATEVGSSGKVVYWNGEGQLEWMQSIECQAIFKNIIMWLDYGDFHDLEASVKLPDLIEPGKSVTIKAEIHNIGYHSEHNVELHLTINATDISLISLGTMEKRTLRTIEYVWTPAREGVYDITAYVSSIPSDINRTNDAFKVLKTVRFCPHLAFTFPKDIQLGQSFSIDVMVQNATDLCGWKLELYYRSYALNVMTVTEGEFLTLGGPTEFEILYCDDAYNTTHGRVWLACSLLDTSNGVSGSGVIATITVKGKASGIICPLSLSDTSLKTTSLPSSPHFCEKRDLVIGLLGDLNNDGTVNIIDVVIVTGVYGSKKGEPDWNPQADIVPDNVINIIDLVKVTANYGRTRNP